MQLYKRRFAIELQIAEKKIKRWESDNISTGLKVDFSISKTIGGIGEQASITIYGLSLQDIQYIASALRPPTDKELPRNYIRLEAGLGSDYGVIFEGGIFEVVPSLDSPDLSVQLNCTAAFKTSNYDNFVYVDKQKPFIDVCKKLAEFMGVPIKASSTQATTNIIDSISINDQPLQVITKLNQYYPQVINVYLCGGVLYVEDGSIGRGGKIIKLTGESGLIGTPQPTIAGLNCKSLLRPSLQAGTFISVESVKLPMLNGTYRIVNLTHTGSSRGDDWYSNIEATRFL